MTTFDDRKDAFEKKFAHDEALQFKATARRNKLLGLWAAELIGKTGDDADAYAREVVSADFEEAGDEDVFRKIRADLDAAGVAQSDHQIRRTMDELLAKAKDQVMKEA
ncbi:DUF1476 domain-containing protein [Prosthecomicrobium pneumaticum]|uniref:Aldolase n=1 Tax=Prosthecomicrobium pneumaticum TaxID=81895 RepID=A0A7W9L3H2_9HYPH|nr:DUF1476 domain-containing protein [Prosthecomicrobium pneumaticum]MBB5754535.1 hypothetical protein [Prosthecomicrobium pneumaticum]